MRFSVASSMGLSWAEVKAATLSAEAYGFDEMLVSDHLEGLMAWDENAGVLDGPVLLGALASITDTLGLRILVSPITMRHPVLLARALQTVDLIAGGRVTIGVGAGWSPDEHERFGIEFPKFSDRVAALEDACDTIKQLWESAEPVHKSGIYPLRGAKLVPRPSTTRAPLLVGGASDASIELAARYATRWNVLGAPGFVRGRIEVLRAAERLYGRADAVEVTVTRMAVFVEESEDFSYPITVTEGPQPQRRYALAGEEYQTMYVGPADGFAADVQEYAAAGVDRIVLPVSAPYIDGQIKTYAQACGLV